jgi:hypothetical protein
MNLITRHTALKDQDFASFLYHWQHSNHPLKDLDLDEPSELDAELQKELDDFNAITDNKPKANSTVYATLVIDVPEHKDHEAYLMNSLSKLMLDFQLGFTFIPLFKTNWFDDTIISTHQPDTIETYNKLKKLIGKESYKGGIQLTKVANLQHFLPLFFNLVASNYLAQNFFYAEQLKTVFSYHYSGQLWMYVLAKTHVKSLLDFLDKNGISINEAYTYFN